MVMCFAQYEPDKVKNRKQDDKRKVNIWREICSIHNEDNSTCADLFFFHWMENDVHLSRPHLFALLLAEVFTTEDLLSLKRR